ncbi:MAG: rhomboid family intramembrane serine protease [Exiguobacterium marinum]|uniref:Rhomboid family intramembrane serine protease n=1 Tax=Exiguobacterium marinum TaxID=273528 RepID=A0ABY7WZ96_9BACL|nr:MULTISPECIES: rhomboid family intramembrane serine protease [Exiguobacterium]WDH76197.1 rhomboid family intramembrane serine protease [Exiguobacterium marinum]
MFSRTENVQTFVRAYPLVTLFIVIQLLVFVIDSFAPGLRIVATGGSFHLALADGQWYRLVTANFIHLSLGHLLFNSFALIIFGPAMERMVGHVKFALFYVLAGALANLLTYFTVSNLFYLQAGASGAILAILGFYVFIGRFRRTLMYSQDARLVYIFVAISAVFTLIGSNVSLWGHVYGFLSGFLLALPLSRFAVPYTRPAHYGKYKQRSYAPPVIHSGDGKWFFYIIIGLAIFGLLAQFL